jgi:hypothetical protein
MPLYTKALLTAFTLVALAGCQSHSGQTVQEPWKLPASYHEERRYRKLLSLHENTHEQVGVEAVETR